MKDLKLFIARIATWLLVFAGIIFVAGNIFQTHQFYLIGSSLILAAISLLMWTLMRMASKKTFRGRYIAGAIPMVLTYFILIMFYLVFFKESEALGNTCGIMLIVTGIYEIVAFVLVHVEEEQQKKVER